MDSHSLSHAPSHALDWPRIEWVLLDMDGTLLDLGYDNWFWRTLVPERYGAARSISSEQAVAELLPHFTSLAHTLPWYCTDHWSGLTGLNIAALKHETRERVSVLDGTEEFLSAVRDSGRKLWLATNAHRDSWRIKLEKTGLAHYFERIVCSHDFGAPKESQLFWNGLMATHPFEPARAAGCRHLRHRPDPRRGHARKRPAPAGDHGVRGGGPAGRPAAGPLMPQ